MSWFPRTWHRNAPLPCEASPCCRRVKSRRPALIPRCFLRECGTQFLEGIWPVTVVIWGFDFCVRAALLFVWLQEGTTAAKAKPVIPSTNSRLVGDPVYRGLFSILQILSVIIQGSKVFWTRIYTFDNRLSWNHNFFCSSNLGHFLIIAIIFRT